jgi:hypothetical protein
MPVPSAPELEPEAQVEATVGVEAEVCTDLLHLFIDHANIAIGAKHYKRPFGTFSAAVAGGGTVASTERKVPPPPASVQDSSVMINVPALVNVIERGRACITKVVVAGSKMNAGVQAKYKQAGFKVASVRPDAGEVFVDEALHAHILRELLRHKSTLTPAADGSVLTHTLVLVTGDGNANRGDDNTSFPECVELALAYGWRVEVYAWELTCSGKYKEIAKRGPNLKLIFLDLCRDAVCYNVT